MGFMAELPSGTVSLLFSDIEGSTVLLSRLGAAYADALDGQRQLLRRAWAEHGGTELGTEGDSFFVVFPTAENAGAAAAQAQRDLTAFDWPGGEQVRVRMGVHTGTPTVHDGGYVGMDVHRAARIAGAAHGGQVVLSEATAKLMEGCLPERVSLRDLGRHQLKDIPHPEHLFQLVVEGLRSDFAPLKTLGAASSLPRPATPLVGRDGELAELSALLSSPELRLVTLTGPGGSGKTRLAVEVAQALVERFPDGVFFVPLAAVTTADVMWTSIAEVLDVPPEGRIPPGFFDHVAHRSALFVLDNLEQISGADRVAAELLDHAKQVVVVATSRRLLGLPAEHVHPVPPLELPDGNSQSEAETSGAVQLFMHHARRVKPSFTLAADNVADVTEVCRRLDGLPLAIELAAARVRLLTPKALLARLDNALDIASGSQAPSRQRTLRQAIAWSYALLTSTEQDLFRRLGVFSGGADLDAVAAVSTDILDEGDPFDLVAALVDASLLSITGGIDGEPRVAMLETIRAYAFDQLDTAEELPPVQRRHAQHYVQLAEQMTGLLKGDQHVTVRARFEIEHDNFRAALTFSLIARPGDAHIADGRTGVRLCAALADFWTASGYYAEGRRWLERAIDHADGDDSIELARCLTELAFIFHVTGMGDVDRAHQHAAASVAMWRRLGDGRGLARALGVHGEMEAERGQYDAARTLHGEALTVARGGSDKHAEMVALGALAAVEFLEHRYERSLELYRHAVAIARQQGDPVQLVITQHNLACTLHKLGRFAEAAKQMLAQVALVLRLNQPAMVTVFAEDLAATLAELGEHRDAVRLLAAAEAMRDRLDLTRPLSQQAFIAAPITLTRRALGDEDWHAAYQEGRNTTLEEALTQAHTATSTISGDYTHGQE